MRQDLHHRQRPFPISLRGSPPAESDGSRRRYRTPHELAPSPQHGKHRVQLLFEPITYVTQENPSRSGFESAVLHPGLAHKDGTKGPDSLNPPYKSGQHVHNAADNAAIVHPELNVTCRRMSGVSSASTHGWTASTITRTIPRRSHRPRLLHGATLPASSEQLLGVTHAGAQPRSPTRRSHNFRQLRVQPVQTGEPCGIYSCRLHSVGYRVELLPA
jgi:hypothetical protein